MRHLWAVAAAKQQNLLTDTMNGKSPSKSIANEAEFYTFYSMNKNTVVGTMAYDSVETLFWKGRSDIGRRGHL